MYSFPLLDQVKEELNIIDLCEKNLRQVRKNLRANGIESEEVQAYIERKIRLVEKVYPEIRVEECRALGDLDTSKYEEDKLKASFKLRGKFKRGSANTTPKQIIEPLLAVFDLSMVVRYSGWKKDKGYWEFVWSCRMNRANCKQNDDGSRGGRKQGKDAAAPSTRFRNQVEEDISCPAQVYVYITPDGGSKEALEGTLAATFDLMHSHSMNTTTTGTTIRCRTHSCIFGKAMCWTLLPDTR